jgi:hypothetical protein
MSTTKVLFAVALMGASALSYGQTAQALLPTIGIAKDLPASEVSPVERPGEKVNIALAVDPLQPVGVSGGVLAQTGATAGSLPTYKAILATLVLMVAIAIRRKRWKES